MITVEVWDASGSEQWPVDLPDDMPVNRILIVLTERLGIPREGPDGQHISYKLHHRRSGKQLLDGKSLQAAGVCAGDVLRLQPEITAGGLCG